MPLGGLAKANTRQVSQFTSSFFFGLTYEARVGLQAHGSALTYTARGRLGRGLAVLLEIGEPGSEIKTAKKRPHCVGGVIRNPTIV